MKTWVWTHYLDSYVQYCPAMAAFSVGVMTSCLLFFGSITLNAHFAWCAEANDRVCVHGSERATFPVECVLVFICVLDHWWCSMSRVCHANDVCVVAVVPERVSCRVIQIRESWLQHKYLLCEFTSLIGVFSCQNELPQILTAWCQSFVLLQRQTFNLKDKRYIKTYGPYVTWEPARTMVITLVHYLVMFIFIYRAAGSDAKRMCKYNAQHFKCL